MLEQDVGGQAPLRRRNMQRLGKADIPVAQAIGFRLRTPRRCRRIDVWTGDRVVRRAGPRAPVGAAITSTSYLEYAVSRQLFTE